MLSLYQEPAVVSATPRERTRLWVLIKGAAVRQTRAQLMMPPRRARHQRGSGAVSFLDSLAVHSSLCAARKARRPSFFCLCWCVGKLRVWYFHASITRRPQQRVRFLRLYFTLFSQRMATQEQRSAHGQKVRPYIFLALSLIHI